MLPSNYYVDKKAGEQMYRLMNDHRSAPLDYHTAFCKFLLVLTDLSECEASSVSHYTKLFFSMAHSNWMLDSDFAHVVDFQYIVSTFEEVALGMDEKERKVNPHRTALNGLISCLKDDIMQGYAIKQPIRHYIHVGSALDLFKDSTFVQLLRAKVPKTQAEGVEVEEAEEGTSSTGTKLKGMQVPKPTFLSKFLGYQTAAERIYYAAAAVRHTHNDSQHWSYFHWIDGVFSTEAKTLAARLIHGARTGN